MEASLWGSINVRPVAVCLASGTEDLSGTIRTCTEIATCFWGGINYPIIPVTDVSKALETAEFFDVDVVHAVDDDGLARQVAESDGFQWRWMSSSPFDTKDSVARDHVLEVGWLLERFAGAASESPPVLITWDEEHPLADLLGVLYGCFGTEELGQGSRERFASVSKSLHLDAEAPLPVLADRNQIAATGFGLHPKGGSGIGIAAIDPHDPLDLIDFWNHRSLGYEVMPWPIGYESLAESSLATWLASYQENWPSVFADKRGLRVWLRDRSSFPDSLESMLKEHVGEGAMKLVDELSQYAAPFGPRWQRVHGIHAGRSFDVTVDKDAWGVDIPAPSVDFLELRFSTDRYGIIAADIEISAENDLRPGRKASAPPVRVFAKALRRAGLPLTQFIRPVHGGLSLGMHPNESLVRVPMISSFQLIEALLRDRGWGLGQSEPGRYVGRLMEVLGGAYEDSSANQPAVRAVLEKAAGGPYGRPVQALIQEAKQHAGDWPPFGSQADSYPKAVVQRLTSINALRTRVKVPCLSCGTSAAITPSDLGDQVVCELCGDSHPLGLVLTLGNPKWLLSTASVLGIERLRETFPIMATLSAFASFADWGRQLPHHVIGLTVEKADFSCEVDIALLMSTRDRPLMIVGEAKSYRDELVEDDVTKLTTVRNAVMSSGLDCHLMFVTMREALTDDETQLIKEAVSQSPMPLSTRPHVSPRPLLPIVLTAEALSSPSHSDNHPSRWAQQSIERLAEESLRREVGFERLEFEDIANPDAGFKPIWIDPEPETG